MSTYPTFVFIEMLNDLYPQVKHLRDTTIDDIKIMVYEGIRGNPVIIDISDDDLEIDIVKGHLQELGLSYLVPTLFPELAN